MSVSGHLLLVPVYMATLVVRRSVVFVFVVFFIVFRHVNFLVRLITVKTMVPPLEGIMIHISGRLGEEKRFIRGGFFHINIVVIIITRSMRPMIFEGLVYATCHKIAQCKHSGDG